MARDAIFRGKHDFRVNGMITVDGYKAFNVARARLSRLAEWPLEQVSDAATIEFLARGEKATRALLDKQP